MPKDSSKEIHIEYVSNETRQRALEEFNDLLKEGTKEYDWQIFFDANPFVLTETLPIQLTGLFRQVPLISGIPDYVFYRKTSSPMTGDYGVIELKRPDQSIIGVYSSKIIFPSRNLRIAYQEATQHLEAIKRGQFLNTDDFFIAGNREHAFIIIGSTKEIIQKCRDEIHRQQLKAMIPKGFHLYTDDEILDLFAARVAPEIKVFLTEAPVGDSINVKRRFIVTNRLGLHAQPAAMLVQTNSRFKSDITIERSGQSVDGKSILGILALAAEKGAELTITARGPDATKVMEQIALLFERKFDED
jgi:phosphocarrier protein HPr